MRKRQRKKQLKKWKTVMAAFTAFMLEILPGKLEAIHGTKTQKQKTADTEE